MSNNETTTKPSIVDRALAVIAEQVAKEEVRSGFFLGLLGSAVKDGKGPDANIVDYTFGVAKGEGDQTRPLTFSRVLTPFPLSQDAAEAMAADCTSTAYVYEESTGEYLPVELKGIAAAVHMANKLAKEGFRSRIRTNKYDEPTLRVDAKSMYSFELPKLEERKLSEAELYAKLAACTTDDERVAVLREMGVKIGGGK